MLSVSVSCWDRGDSPGALATVAMWGRADVELDLEPDLDLDFRGFDEVVTADEDLKCGVERDALKSPRWLWPEGNRKLRDTVIRPCLPRGSAKVVRLGQGEVTYSASSKSVCLR